LEFETCGRYEFTYEYPEYDPSAKTFHNQEAGMMDSWGNLKVSGDFHPKRLQVCSLLQKEAEVKLLSSKYSDTSAKLQDLSSVLDDRKLLAELDDITTNLIISLVKSEMRDKAGVYAATLTKNWGIGIEAAKSTRLVTTQKVIRIMIHPSLTKGYKTNDRQLRYRRLPVNMYTDTMFSTILSRQDNKAAQIFCTDFGFVRAFPMKKEKEAHEDLSLLFHRDGIPNGMIMDGAKAYVEGEFRRKLCDAGCHIKQTEPHTQSYNMGEGGVRELKKGVGRQMLRSGCPKRFWDDCIIREAYVRSHTSLDIFGLEVQVPESNIKGEKVDISTIAEYAWYEWVKFRDTAAKFPVSKIQLGRDLGSAIDICSAMTRKILNQNGSVTYRSSVRPLTQDEIQSPTEKKEREEFDIAVKNKFCPAMNKDDFQDDPDYADVVTPTYECYEDDAVSPSKMPYTDDIKEEHDVDTYDQYVGAHVRVPIGDEIRSGKVVRRKRELDDTVRRRANAKSMLDTRTYEIEFPDGRSDEYTANVITDNMYAQCDIEGRQYNLMEGIIDRKTDRHAIEPAGMYIKHDSNKKVSKTAKCWHLCVEWKDVTTSWERLVDIKESNPVEVAEYAASKSLLDTLAFVWWAPHVLNKRTRSISPVTKRYHKRTHKFGIEVPRSWNDCVRLERENDNTLWQDAVRKEMQNVRIAFKILNGEESVPPNLPRDPLPYDILCQDGRFPAQGKVCCRWAYN
jgi:hypothetical protein